MDYEGEIGAADCNKVAHLGRIDRWEASRIRLASMAAICPKARQMGFESSGRLCCHRRALGWRRAVL